MNARANHQQRLPRFEQIYMVAYSAQKRVHCFSSSAWRALAITKTHLAQGRRLQSWHKVQTSHGARE
jgi:hypothetical protein